jgi:zinc protease
MNRTVTLTMMISLFIFSSPILSQVEEIPMVNGPAIIFEKNPYSDISIIHLLIRGGKQSEPPNRSGVAYLATRLSVEVHDAFKQKKMVEMGSHFDFRVENDYSLISIRCLTPFLKETLEIFCDTFTSPLFSSLRINRIRQQVIHLQKTESDQATNLMKLTALGTFFASAGYGGSVYGNPESIKRIGRKEIKDFYSSYFCRNNMIIAIASNLEKSEMAAILSSTISRIPAGERIVFNRQKILKPIKKDFYITRERKQALISFAYGTPQLNPENFDKTFLLENLIGKGLGSELWRLRETEKLAYLVNAEAIQLKEAGILMVYLKTEQNKKKDAREKLNAILLNLAEEDFSPEDLNMHKNHALADFYRLNESAEKHVLMLALFELLGPGYQYVEKMPLKIDRLSTEKFNAFKREIFHPENRIEILIGTEKTVGSSSD